MRSKEAELAVIAKANRSLVLLAWTRPLEWEEMKGIPALVIGPGPGIQERKEKLQLF